MNRWDNAQTYSRVFVNVVYRRLHGAVVLYTGKGGDFLAYDEKAKERTIRYMKDKRDKLTLNLPAGDKERYKAHAEQRNMSLTGLIVDLLEKDIQDLNK